MILPTFVNCRHEKRKKTHDKKKNTPLTSLSFEANLQLPEFLRLLLKVPQISKTQKVYSNFTLFFVILQVLLQC